MRLVLGMLLLWAMWSGGMERCVVGLVGTGRLPGRLRWWLREMLVLPLWLLCVRRWCCCWLWFVRVRRESGCMLLLLQLRLRMVMRPFVWRIGHGKRRESQRRKACWYSWLVRGMYVRDVGVGGRCAWDSALGKSWDGLRDCGYMPVYDGLYNRNEARHGSCIQIIYSRCSRSLTWVI